MYNVQFFTQSRTPNEWENLNGLTAIPETQAWTAFAEMVFNEPYYQFRIVDETGNVITQ